MKKLTNITSRRLVAGTALAGLALNAWAADSSTSYLSTSWQKPAWLTELSLGVAESYDDNIFGVYGTATPKIDSWVTTLSPKIAFNFAPLLTDSKDLQTLSLSYAPEINVYHNAVNENNTAHRIGTTLKGKSDALSYNLDNALVYVDGASIAPVYSGPDSARSAFATGMPRERREQFQDRAAVVLQYDWDKVFVRGVGNLLYYNLQTDQSTIEGYQNYADRYEVSGGLDLGYKITDKLAATVGYRYGHQYQEKIIASRYQSVSDLQRILLGLEGKPLKWLTVGISGGLDFRDYVESTPIRDMNGYYGYGEANVTAAITSDDSVNLKYKGFQWVSSTGSVPYFESSYALTYTRKFGSKFSANLNGKAANGDYNCGSLASANRNDWLYSAGIGLNYAINKNLAASLAYTASWGRSEQPNIANDQFREFDRQLVTLGVSYKF